MKAKGDWDGVAREAFAGLGIAKDLLKRDPNEVVSSHYVSSYLILIGEASFETDEMEKAEQAYSEAIDVLVNISTGNNEVWGFPPTLLALQQAYEKLGDVRRAKRDEEGARRAYHSSQLIAEKIAEMKENET